MKSMFKGSYRQCQASSHIGLIIVGNFRAEYDSLAIHYK